MRSTIHLLFFILFSIAIIGCGDKVTDVTDSVKPRVKDTVRIFTKPGLTQGFELIKDNRTPYEDADVIVGNKRYYCTYKGKIFVSDTMGGDRRLLFNMKIEFMIDKTFLYPMDDHTFFVFWQETNHEGVKCSAAVFLENSSEPEWIQVFRSPNPGQPVIDGNDAYFSTLGTVGKMNIPSGKMIWIRDSMYNTTTLAYNKFEPARVFENKVQFIDFPVKGRRNKRDTLILDPKTGANLR